MCIKVHVLKLKACIKDQQHPKDIFCTLDVPLSNENAKSGLALCLHFEKPGQIPQYEGTLPVLLNILTYFIPSFGP